MNDSKTKPSIRELRDFALTMSWAIPALFMFLLPWLFNQPLPWWPVACSIILLFLYLFLPLGISPIYRFWMRIAAVLGWINTRLILAIVFYGIIFPLGVLLRLFGKLQFKMKESKELPSYWKKRETNIDKEDLERPF